MKNKGLSVVIKNEKEFNRMKEFLGDYLYFDFVEQMEKVETAVIIYYDDTNVFSIGSVGSAEYHRKCDIRVINFCDFFIC